jgi:hypothetical protein
MIDELERLEGSGRGRIDVLSQHLTRETEQNHENLRMASVSSRILTEFLPNTSFARYRGIN